MALNFQITNFIASLAETAAAASCTGDPLSTVDFSPTSLDSHNNCRIKEQGLAPAAVSDSIWRSFVPSVHNMVNEAVLPQFHVTRENSIRDFGVIAAQLESPLAQAFESSNVHGSRSLLSEDSLSLADFRHAIDVQIDHASSIWSNN